jgi:hypothetical protein
MKMMKYLALAAIMAGSVGVLSAAAQEMETISPENDIIVRCWDFCNKQFDGVQRQRCMVKCEADGGPPAR